MQEHYLHQQYLQQQQQQQQQQYQYQYQYPQALLPSFQQQINHHHAALALNSSSLLYKHSSSSSSSSSILPPLLRPNNTYSQASMQPSMHYHLSQQQQQQQQQQLQLQLQQVAVGNCNSFPLLPTLKVNLPAAAEHERIDTNTSTTCNYSDRYETKTMTGEELEQFKRVTSRIINLYGTLSNDPC
ncbi:hypothetical protein FRACYDRAFT_272282 [Fragilariopsis cylindrus CCMP1102]|uniref:Uncharacterized protein n=1 Tax=Fragilariopsis cylindrus CCMP1102 TaxID=635003 RepID=A0A1E7EM92_9STRA|nr:hypothetical protein FRACYDRAFT_272282 [Fragilariopsis cylindrus CCMP1102]|eukprot:OEU07011.1 hypothetical protein FRACYDRAFT_272282 [Fragilariopsis cylindrus CCMP1102]